MKEQKTIGQRISTSSIDGRCPAGWLTLRKYDGFSCLWIPAMRSETCTGLFTIGDHQGKPREISAPEWWIDNLPSIAVHGELWTDSDSSFSVASLITKKPIDSNWEKLKLVAFAFPKNSGFDPKDPATYKRIENKTDWKINYDMFIQTKNCFAAEILTRNFDFVYAGYEGVVYQNPAAMYENGRTKNVIKHKKQYDDEMRVISTTDTTITGTYTITEKFSKSRGFSRDFIGKTIEITTSKNKIECNKGDAVTFSFLSFTKNGELMGVYAKCVRAEIDSKKSFSRFLRVLWNF